MPKGRDHKKYADYGPHKYADHDGTSDCEFGCGCVMGPTRSRGPAGISPFGKCPNNPIDGERQPGKDDYEDCVNGRIAELEGNLSEAKKAVIMVGQAKKESKISLVKEQGELLKENSDLRALIKKARQCAEQIKNVLADADSIGA
ncbi:MAG: hypothetical protein HY764_04550 [Candidatus Portnoybacteria bacterium]|nr:hypothetical protein [Candidatus Portnoybacteria bacterium]